MWNANSQNSILSFYRSLLLSLAFTVSLSLCLFRIWWTPWWSSVLLTKHFYIYLTEHNKSVTIWSCLCHILICSCMSHICHVIPCLSCVLSLVNCLFIAHRCPLSCQYSVYLSPHVCHVSLSNIVSCGHCWVSLCPWFLFHALFWSCSVLKICKDSLEASCSERTQEKFIQKHITSKHAS